MNKDTKQLLSKGWVQKTVRISDDYNKLYTFIELYAKENNLNVKTIFNSIFIYSLDHIVNNGFKYTVIPYNKRREPKGFLISNDTYTKMKDYYEVYKLLYLKLNKSKLYYAEFIELLMYVYCINNFDEKFIDYINTKINWHIERK